MHDTNNVYGDSMTAEDRLNWFFVKNARKAGLSVKTVKIIKFLILILSVIWIALAIQSTAIDQGIKAQQLHNLVVYKDINGFKPVHFK